MSWARRAALQNRVNTPAIRKAKSLLAKESASLGFIVMVDSTRPETFREARSILETFRAYAPTPFVVAANKQDMEDAWELEDVRHALRLDGKTKLLPCVATERDTVKTVLLELLYSIMQEMDSKK